ncbi:MAG: aroma-sacti cluster domain-containing protein [Streptosporangiaceae bacterium]
MADPRFAKAGIDLDIISAKQRAVLESLTPAEADMLITVKQRIDTVDGDVEGHAAAGDGGIFW